MSLGTLSVDGDHFLQLSDRGTIVALITKNQGQLIVGLRLTWIEFDGLLEVCPRGRKVMHTGPDHPQREEGKWVLGTQFCETLKSTARLFRIPVLKLCNAQQIQGVQVVGPQLYELLGRTHRVCRVSCMQAGCGELAQNVLRVRQDSASAAQQLQGFFPLALAGQHTCQGLQGVCRVWVQVYSSSKVLLGECEFALAFPCPAQRKEQCSRGSLLFLCDFQHSESIVWEIEIQEHFGKLHAEPRV